MNIHNDDCYSVYHLQLDSPTLFDDCVDATFVLTMEGSTRANKFMEQLYKFRPTKNVYIIFNKGYKTCDKLDCLGKYKINNSRFDINDAYFYMLKFSKQMNFKYVLNLEDDFEFVDTIINDLSHSKEICRFIKSKNPNVYSLGNIILISPSFLSVHRKAFKLAPAHSLILKVDSVFDILEKEMCKNEGRNLDSLHVDIHIISSLSDKYYYNKPLCTQKFVNTENRNIWLDNKFLSNILLFFIKILKLDSQQNGWFFVYIIYDFLILFISLIIFMIFTKNMKRIF